MRGSHQGVAGKERVYVALFLATYLALITYDQDGIEVFDDRATFSKFYKTYRQEDLRDMNVVDIIITGKVRRNLRKS